MVEVKKSTFFFSVLALVAPLIVALVFHPLWAIAQVEKSGIGVLVALTVMMLNSFITPLYLAITVRYIAVKGSFDLFLGNTISIITLYASIYIQYWNWASATGMFSNPDSATKMLVLIEVVVATIIFTIGIIIAVKKKR